MSTYSILRFFQNEPNRTIKEGLTLKEAQGHCSDPETSSRTCEDEEGLERTRKSGAWFDGYEEE